MVKRWEKTSSQNKARGEGKIARHTVQMKKREQIPVFNLQGGGLLGVCPIGKRGTKKEGERKKEMTQILQYGAGKVKAKSENESTGGAKRQFREIFI